MKLKLKAEISRNLEPDLVEQLEVELHALSDQVLEAGARFHVIKIENLLCERPSNDLVFP